MRIVLCDRCGGKIAKGETIGHLSAWYEGLKGLDRAKPEYNGWDFCPTCMENINSCIKGIICMPETEPAGSIADDLEEELDTEEAEEEPDIESEDEPINELISEPIAEPADEVKDKPTDEPQKKPIGGSRPNSGRKPNVDWPKFKACVDAGKDNKWLAVEFGVEVEKIPKWRWLLKDKISKGQIK